MLEVADLNLKDRDMRSAEIRLILTPAQTEKETQGISCILGRAVKGKGSPYSIT